MRNRLRRGNGPLGRGLVGVLGALTAAVLVAAPAAAAPADPVDPPVASDAPIVALATPTTTDVVVGARIAYERVPVADMDNPAFLAGVTFELYTPAGPGDSGGPGTATGYTCAIPEGALECTIEVPDTGAGGANEGRRFYVVTTSAGAAAQPITSLSTGTSSDPSTVRSYPGLTPALVANQTVAFPAQGEGETLNSQVVAAALNNPQVQPVCVRTEPLDIAALMDLSGSVNGPERAQYAAAFTTMVDELEGLPIELTLSTFGSSSPVAGRESGPWSLDDPADVAALRDDIVAFTQGVAGPTQQTNWDLPLRRVADQPGAFDVLLMLTDGAPNWVSNNAGNGGVPVAGSSVTIASIEQAVFSANAVKAEGTRVVAMGVGNALTGEAADNLAAISGPTLDEDYFLGEWATLTEDLRAAVGPIIGGAVADGSCTLPVTVTKLLADAQGENPVPADDWSFTLDVSDATSGTTSITGENPQLTGSGDNADGEAAWDVIYTEWGATATVTVTEAAQTGFTLVGTEFTVTHIDGTTTTGTGTSTELSIPGILSTDVVDVEFTNAPAAATFQVRKQLSGDAAADVPAGTEFEFTYTVNGTPAETPLVVRADGTVVDGPELTHGDEVVVTESTPPAVDGIVWGAQPEPQAVTLDAESTPVLTFVNVATPAEKPVTPVTPANPAGSLPATGADISPLPFVLGGAALIAGLALVVMARRRAASRS